MNSEPNAQIGTTWDRQTKTKDKVPEALTSEALGNSAGQQ